MSVKARHLLPLPAIVVVRRHEVIPENLSGLYGFSRNRDAILACHDVPGIGAALGLCEGWVTLAEDLDRKADRLHLEHY